MKYKIDVALSVLRHNFSRRRIHRSNAAGWVARKSLAMPEARESSIVGMGTGMSPKARTPGDMGGAETRLLTQTELPNVSLFAANTDNVSDASPNVIASEALVERSTASSSTNYHLNVIETEADVGLTSPMADGNAHADMPPWLALHWISRPLQSR